MVLCQGVSFSAFVPDGAYHEGIDSMLIWKKTAENKNIFTAFDQCGDSHSPYTMNL